MTTPTTPRPAPEAVEAAMRWATDKGTAEDHEILAGDDPYCPETDTAARILATEVEWLRAERDALAAAVRESNVSLARAAQRLRRAVVSSIVS